MSCIDAAIIKALVEHIGGNPDDVVAGEGGTNALLEPYASPGVTGKTFVQAFNLEKFELPLEWKTEKTGTVGMINTHRVYATVDETTLSNLRTILSKYHNTVIRYWSNMGIVSEVMLIDGSGNEWRFGDIADTLILTIDTDKMEVSFNVSGATSNATYSVNIYSNKGSNSVIEQYLNALKYQMIKMTKELIDEKHPSE